MAQQRIRESGIAPAHERIWASQTIAAEANGHMEMALAECTRAEANLGSLLRGLSHLTAGANAAREANAVLLRELDEVRELLGRSNEHELSLRVRVQTLEQALEATERDAALSRAVLIEQEDLFLAELLTDHERQVRGLQRQLSALETGNPLLMEGRAPSPVETTPLVEARRGLESPPPLIEGPSRGALQDDIDSLEELALHESELEERNEDERESRIVPISTLPPPPDFRGDPGPETLPPPPSIEARKIGALVLRTISIGAASPTAKTESAFPAVTATPTEELGEPVKANGVDSQPHRSESKPGLKMKPDPTTRPLVGYSLGSDEVAEERIDTSRLGRPTNG